MNHTLHKKYKLYTHRLYEGSKSDSADADMDTDL